MKLNVLNPLRWNKTFLLSLLVAVSVIWFSFIDVYSLKTRWELRSQKNDLIAKTAELNQKSAEISEKMKQLENNPALLEKIAREEYGMRKPGEIVYKIKPKK